MALHIYIDADACPVKQEAYRVAERNSCPVTLVANSRMRTPYYPWLTLVVVGDGLDEADRWIVDHITPGDIVITADIPLADHSIKAGARVLSPTGKEFTEENVGTALAMRNIMTDLRSAGTITGGPPPFGHRDRSRFLQQLERMIVAIRQEEGNRP